MYQAWCWMSAWEKNTKATKTTIKRGKFSSHELSEHPTKYIDDKDMVSAMYNGS
jgi:hypothetical protein